MCKVLGAAPQAPLVVVVLRRSRKTTTTKIFGGGFATPEPPPEVTLHMPCYWSEGILPLYPC